MHWKVTAVTLGLVIGFTQFAAAQDFSDPETHSRKGRH